MDKEQKVKLRKVDLFGGKNHWQKLFTVLFIAFVILSYVTYFAAYMYQRPFLRENVIWTIRSFVYFSAFLLWALVIPFGYLRGLFEEDEGLEVLGEIIGIKKLLRDWFWLCILVGILIIFLLGGLT